MQVRCSTVHSLSSMTAGGRPQPNIMACHIPRGIHVVTQTPLITATRATFISSPPFVVTGRVEHRAVDNGHNNDVHNVSYPQHSTPPWQTSTQSTSTPSPLSSTRTPSTPPSQPLQLRVRRKTRKDGSWALTRLAVDVGYVGVTMLTHYSCSGPHGLRGCILPPRIQAHSRVPRL